MIQASMETTNLSSLNYSFKSSDIGDRIYQLVSQLYPICRSITGNGVRETLKLLQEHIPLKIAEIPTGTEVFDWTVPKEWNIRDAYIKNLKGEKIVDFQKCNLHVVNYSVPVHQVISLSELKARLHTLPEHPDRIPYRTSYYKETWGFCLSHEQLLAMQDEEYEVYIDSSLEPGYLTYGEYYLPGDTEAEILISCHTCHPSLCNDNLSGISLATFLALHLSQLQSRRFSYRFLFIPGTIGSISWLALNEQNVNKIAHGLVVTGVGDAGKYTYKKSRRGNTDTDRAAIHVLQNSGSAYQVIDFFPYGYDERQYCSPGFNLAVGCFMRSSHGHYSEYHTSADNLSFVKPEYLGDSFTKLLSILYVLENNRTYLNQNPKCEPRLGKRGLYRAVGGHAEEQVNELALLWVLNLSDGEYSLLDIAERAQLSFDTIKKAADALLNCGLLKVESSTSL